LHFPQVRAAVARAAGPKLKPDCQGESSALTSLGETHQVMGMISMTKLVLQNVPG
jgi:hypothetical protein